MNILRLAIAILFVSVLMADQHSVDADDSADFSQFHSFVIRQGNINSKKPELNSPIVKQRIGDAIREQLTSKGSRPACSGPT